MSHELALTLKPTCPNTGLLTAEMWRGAGVEAKILSIRIRWSGLCFYEGALRQVLTEQDLALFV